MEGKYVGVTCIQICKSLKINLDELRLVLCSKTRVPFCNPVHALQFNLQFIIPDLLRNKVKAVKSQIFYSINIISINFLYNNILT